MSTERVTLTEALGQILAGAGGPDGVVGYVAGPEAVRWFRLATRVDGGVVPNWGPGGKEPVRAFELVAFDGTTVWRWVRDGESRGALADRPSSGGDEGSREDRALLAGSCHEQQGDWSLLQDQRGARYWLPLALERGQRAALVQYEVVTVEEVGNARVAEVLPVRLETAKEGGK